MSSPAYLPLFGSDYLADTTHLSTEEHGAYLLLMLAAWRQEDCDLPNDDKKLSRITGLGPRKWAAIKSTILAFWTIEGDRIYQGRLRQEFGYARKKSEANRRNAGKRWETQTFENIEGEVCDRISDGNAPQPQPQRDTPKGVSLGAEGGENADGESKPKKAKAKPVEPLPDWIPAEEWDAFLLMRKKLGKAPTDRAVELLIRKLDGFRTSGFAPGIVLDQSTVNCWIDVYQPKGGNNGRSYNGNRGGSDDGFAGAIDDRLEQLRSGRSSGSA